MQLLDPRPVLVIDVYGRPRWSPIWENNPRIMHGRHGKDYQSLLNGPGARPYVEHKLSTRWVWRNNFRIEQGEIYLSDAERAFAEPWRGRVLVEPNVKAKPEAVNKQWLWARWQALADHYGNLLQIGPAGTRRLSRVAFVETIDFRHACAVLSVCRAFVGTEGGLHHAAAALGVPSVVLFSGFISPSVTGYASQRNIHHGGTACGARFACLHCKEAMEAITVDEVVATLNELL